MTKIHYNYLISFFSLVLFSCTSGTNDSAETTSDNYTPVSITAVNRDTISEYIELSATSAFLSKSFIKASTNGYLKSVHALLGAAVDKGQALFILETKEAQSLNDGNNENDSIFRFSGLSPIHAARKGYITELNHQQGDYVQEGEQLAIISDHASLVFLMNLPYEFRSLLNHQPGIYLELPDGQIHKGKVSSSMPSIDPVSQTQAIVIKLDGNYNIPENLIAKVRLAKTIRKDVQVIAREALLTDETQSEFWVMKMINDSTAVRTMVKKGLENKERIEILSPVFSDNDRILLTGNYGLPDTAFVKIEKVQQ